MSSQAPGATALTGEDSTLNDEIGTAHERTANSTHSCLNLHDLAFPERMQTDTNISNMSVGSSSSFPTDLFPDSFSSVDEPLNHDTQAPLLQIKWDEFDASRSFDFLGHSDDLNDHMHRLMDMSFLSYYLGSSTQPSPRQQPHPPPHPFSHASPWSQTHSQSSSEVSDSRAPSSPRIGGSMWKPLDESNWSALVDKVENLELVTALSPTTDL